VGIAVERFQRKAPYPRSGTVAAVGRLVEKKGFRDLVEAIGLMRDGGASPQLVICGEGPLRDQLEDRIAALGLRGSVRLVEGWGAGAVSSVLEEAAVLAMPCVVAADGDRDGIPTVVKEALAMEVPVVGSSEVGMPEVVTDGWGRLVPPGDPAALADALEEVLSLPYEERLRMGRRGREFVVEHCDVGRVTEELSSLLEHAIARSPGAQNIGVR
jgi:glycosyltransferase involved in cell wall biosynthesis